MLLHRLTLGSFSHQFVLSSHFILAFTTDNEIVARLAIKLNQQESEAISVYPCLCF